MKNTLLLLSLLVAFASQAQQQKTKVVLVPESDTQQVIAFTTDVIGIIDAKCLGCHSPSARNEKSKEALQWEQLQTLKGTDAYAQLDAILEVLEEGAMPPAKVLERYPNMKLTEAESEALKSWANELLTQLEN